MTSVRFAAIPLYLLLLNGCAGFIPASGPTKKEVEAEAAPKLAATIQVVDLDANVARQLLSKRSQSLFSETLGEGPAPVRGVGAGDSIEVSIWEAVPATLFASPSLDARSPPSASHATTLPDQVVDADGTIVVPFAGRVPVGGKTLREIEAEITRRLAGKANQPEALARLTRSVSSNVTVVGEVNTSTRMAITPGRERLLDALAAAAGVRQPVNKVTIQVTRGSSVHALPLETIIRDPRQNVPLYPGDVVTALFQPLSFTALGATGKNEEVPFEARGISLAQALARAGGLQDSRSDPRGVFIFRFEPAGTLDWPRKPVAMTPDGLVPVVYRIDLLDPGSFFVMQNFAVNDRDVLYVSNAPLAELQKFLNAVFSIAYPVLTAVQVGK